MRNKCKWPAAPVAAILFLLPAIACAHASVPTERVVALPRTVGCVQDANTPEGFCQIAVDVVNEINTLAQCQLFKAQGNGASVYIVSSAVVPVSVNPGHRLGETQMFKDGSAYVILNLPLIYRLGYSSKTVLRHELMHALGAGHAEPGALSIMRPSARDSDAGFYRKMDVRWLRALCARQ